MPLTPSEVTFLIERTRAVYYELMGEPLSAPPTYTPGRGSDIAPLLAATDRLLNTVDQLISTMAPLAAFMQQIMQGMEAGERSGAATIMQPQHQLGEGPQEPPKKRRPGRPSNAEIAEREKASAGNGQVPAAGTAPEQPAASPATEAPRQAQPPSGEPASDDEMPDFLKRDAPAKTQDTTGFQPEPQQQQQPPAQELPGQAMTEQTCKAILRQYMQKYGSEGTAKLTGLLMKFGVKQFAQLPAAKYGEIAAMAQTEMAKG